MRVQGKANKYNVSEVLKVSPQSKEIDNSLKQKQLGIFRADTSAYVNVRELSQIEAPGSDLDDESLSANSQRGQSNLL